MIPSGRALFSLNVLRKCLEWQADSVQLSLSVAGNADVYFSGLSAELLHSFPISCPGVCALLAQPPSIFEILKEMKLEHL